MYSNSWLLKLAKTFEFLSVCTVANKYSAEVLLPLVYRPKVLSLITLAKVSCAFIAIFVRCTTNKHLFGFILAISKALRKVLPVPVALIIKALFLPLSLNCLKLSSASH